MTTAQRLPPAGAAGRVALPAPDPGSPPRAGEPGAGPRGRRGGRGPRRLRYAVAGAVLAGAFAVLLAKGLGSSLDFYLPADQAVAQRAQLAGRTVNLEGVVEQGSVHATRRGVDFVVTAGRARVPVDETGSPPQLFAAGIPVIAVGHFAGATFESDQILVKHSATYIAAHPGRVTAPDGSRR